MSARDRILGRVREGLASRSATPHPGDFGSWGLGDSSRDRIVEPPGTDRRSGGRAPATGEGRESPDPATRFASTFAGAGGEVVFVSDSAAAAAWLEESAAGFPTVVAGEGVPDDLVPHRPRAEADTAGMAVSWASGAAAESGTLVLESSDGRRAQLLAPVHVVVLPRKEIRGTLAEALSVLRDRLPSAVGLHSGPSKSADIGQVMVRGVHGPGRVIALVVGDEE